MARPHIEPFVDRDVDFKKMTLPGFPKGMKYKVLSLDTDTGACSLTVRFESGYRQPPGMSYSEMELFITSGSVKYGDDVYAKGNYFFVPAGVSMPAMSSPQGAEGLLFYNFGEPSFIESDEDHSRALRDQLDHRGRLPGIAVESGGLRAPVSGARLHGQAAALRSADPCAFAALLHDSELLAGQHFLPRLCRGELSHLRHLLDDAVR